MLAPITNIISANAIFVFNARRRVCLTASGSALYLPVICWPIESYAVYFSSIVLLLEDSSRQNSRFEMKT
jgi:hypothetical protein